MDTSKRQGHTPGPWRVGNRGTAVFAPSDGMPCPPVVADVRHRRDAALIAASPALYAALRAIVDGLTNGQIDRGETAQTIARSALAAVDGGAA
jgi:hypothetical protein